MSHYVGFEETPPFCPPEELSFDNIPTYLFRLHAPLTFGKPTTTEVASPACRLAKGMTGDLFQYLEGEAAELLSDHLLWEKSNPLKRNLTSWSSSLLVVLEYGLYRFNTDHDKPGFDKIYILMLDTRGFPRGTFIQDLDAIKTIRQYRPGMKRLEMLYGWRTLDEYFGEYLNQGRLNVDGKCSQTSMKQLIDGGLFQLCPALKREGRRNAWARRVMTIRNEFKSPAESTTKENVRTAIVIAQACFGGRWALPLATMLLSLCHRQYDSDAILEGFYSMFTDDEIRDLNIRDMKFDPEYKRLPELRQQREMIRAISRRYTQGSGVDALTEKLGNTYI
ncbi:hypothetical protein F5Y04DRAFT_269929 [Hypomontagnella monticulosa]|nr:hypothetical protein F5Y04DRAFT_269929 [Hypomontagnella monticulosa]